METESRALRYQGGTESVLNLMRFAMTMSEITNKLKYDISDALKRVAGRLSLRKEGQGGPSSTASDRSGLKK